MDGPGDTFAIKISADSLRLGGEKRYLCKVCGFDADRDHNGARNILIRHLSLNMK